MLKLRRGRVVTVRAGDRVTEIEVLLEGEAVERRAIAYPGLTGAVEPGDEVVVNVEAQDLGLGSGGFDIVCVNLTRGLSGEGEEGAHVVKLNYTPIQHAVSPIEEGMIATPADAGPPVAVLGLHGQLAPAAFAAAERMPGARVGYVQTAGGALAGQLSDVVAELVRERAPIDSHQRGLIDGRRHRLIDGHVTVAPCFGGEHEAITVEGALHAGVERLGWQAALAGPGPGILGSESTLGHGGLEALHSAHSALSMGCPVILAPRMSSGDARDRHRGLSHHTAAVLARLREPVEVVVASGLSEQARSSLGRVLDQVSTAHVAVEVPVDDLLDGYRESGLPAGTMGRSIGEDEDFFRAALAAGARLAEQVGERR